MAPSNPADGWPADTTFKISLNDLDEFDVTAPTDSNPAANAVNENTVNGTTVGITATASDADATTNAVTYSLTDSAGGRFTIDANTGIVTVADGSLLNREAAASHNITVRATSADGSSADTAFTINLNDVDEFDVTAPTDSNGAANAVNENAVNGTTVGITAAASDNDATTNAVTYSLTDNVATVGFMTWWGKRIDRAGSIKVLKITSLFVPFVPLGWLPSHSLWWLAIMQVFSGFAWAGFQLSAGVFIFDAAPPRNRTPYIALYNSLIYLGASVGALVGGVVTPHLPPILGSSFLSIFAVSGTARLAVALFFLRRIKEVRKVPQIEAGELLFSDFQRPWIDRAYGYVVGYFRSRKTD